jgi:hypothetical protein
MIPMRPARALLLLALPAFAFAQEAASAPAAGNDYPTSERVVYVEACMRDHPGSGHYEMLNKCSCALDYIRAKVSFDDYDTLSTVANAATIGGERGSEFRDAPAMQDKVKQFRKLQADAQKSCMFPPVPGK